jgi:hypothetical protein
MTLLGVKNMRESEFDIFEAKKRFPDSGKLYLRRNKIENRIFATFRFNTQYAFPESGKRFSA